MLTDKNDNRFLNVLNDIDDDLVEEIAEAPVEPEIIPAVPKKSRFIRFIPAAASLAIVAAVGIGALIVGRNVFSPWGGGNTAGNESEPMSSETEQSDIQTDSTADTTPSQSSDQEEIGLSPLEYPKEINTDIISELGMTYRQMTEKYGEARGGIFNTYEFGGYGRYTWKSYEGKFYDDDMESAGGCNYIAGVKPKELFLGAAFPMDFEELANQYDLVPVSIGSEIGMDDCYWAEFTCSLYDNVKFVFATLTYGSIDETVPCTVKLDVDCLEAKPVITASTSESPTGTNTDTTSAAVKDPESSSIKPNNGASDEEVAFLANAEQLVNSVEQIEELKRLLMEIKGVTDVQVYNGSDVPQNIEHQITEGKAAQGMIVKVFYDNGKSWVEYTKQ